VSEQLTRAPKAPPQVRLNPAIGICLPSLRDIELLNYEYHPAIKAPMAVYAAQPLDCI